MDNKIISIYQSKIYKLLVIHVSEWNHLSSPLLNSDSETSVLKTKAQRRTETAYQEISLTTAGRDFQTKK
jgi:hypothetical protein